MLRLVARARVPLGFLAAAAGLILAAPSWRSWIAGGAIAAAGEVIRLWAAGHIEKGREITRSGPYRYVRHPLYLGSTLIGLGFAIAARSPVVAVLAATYLAVTLLAAIRTEEAVLDAKFGGAYSQYRAGHAAPVERPFSWARAWRNREHRAMIGLLLAFAYLAGRLLVS
jgi:protein-S-isoprenylcysteine O-methyltransferase Ste14